MKINFNKKKIVALLLGGVMFVTCRGLVNASKASQENDMPLGIVTENINNDNNINDDNSIVADKTSEEFNVEEFLSSKEYGNLMFTGNVNLFVNPGDLEAMVNVNLRRGNGTDSVIIGKVCGGEKVTVYGITDNGWYLINCNGVLGFAHSNYFLIKTLSSEVVDFIKTIQNNMTSLDTIENEQDNSVISGKLEEMSIYEMYPDVLPLEGYMYANVNVHFRKGPSKKTDSITLIKKGQELKLLGSYNGWYLVEYNGKVGYVYSYYVSYDRWAEYRDDFIDVVYITYDTPLLDSDSETANAKYFFNKYEVCEVLGMNNEWYYVRYEDMYGYIRRNCTCKIGNKAVVVDIDNQRLTLYDNNRIVVETDVVTGTLGVYDTPTGMYYIKNKVTDTSLVSEKYGYNQPVDYWMPFNGGIGLHDANWRSEFGGDIYIKNGSHGCVNIPPKYADDVFDNVDYKTKVIVHK